MFFRLVQKVHLSFSVIAHLNREKIISILERESVFLNDYNLYYYFEQKHMIHRLEGMGGYWLTTYTMFKYRNKLHLCMERCVMNGCCWEAVVQKKPCLHASKHLFWFLNLITHIPLCMINSIQVSDHLFHRVGLDLSLSQPLFCIFRNQDKDVDVSQ